MKPQLRITTLGIPTKQPRNNRINNDGKEHIFLHSTPVKLINTCITMKKVAFPHPSQANHQEKKAQADPTQILLSKKKKKASLRYSRNPRLHSARSSFSNMSRGSTRPGKTGKHHSSHIITAIPNRQNLVAPPCLLHEHASPITISLQSPFLHPTHHSRSRPRILA